MSTQEHFIPAPARERIARYYGQVIGRSQVGDPPVELSEHYDIEFPNMYQAMYFAAASYERVELVEPVHSLDELLTLRVRIPGSFDENRDPGTLTR